MTFLLSRPAPPAEIPPGPKGARPPPPCTPESRQGIPGPGEPLRNLGERISIPPRGLEVGAREYFPEKIFFAEPRIPPQEILSAEDIFSGPSFGEARLRKTGFSHLRAPRFAQSDGRRGFWIFDFLAGRDRPGLRRIFSARIFPEKIFSARPRMFSQENIPGLRPRGFMVGEGSRTVWHHPER